MAAVSSNTSCTDVTRTSATTSYSALGNGDSSPNAMAIGGWDADNWTGSSPY
jgi:hypothetical protein